MSKIRTQNSLVNQKAEFISCFEDWLGVIELCQSFLTKVIMMRKPGYINMAQKPSVKQVNGMKIVNQDQKR